MYANTPLIMILSGTKTRSTDSLRAALAMREAFFNFAQRTVDTNNTIWIIECCPTTQAREHRRAQLRCEVVLPAESASICKQRLLQRDGPNANLAEVDKWW